MIHEKVRNTVADFDSCKVCGKKTNHITAMCMSCRKAKGINMVVKQKKRAPLARRKR